MTVRAKFICQSIKKAEDDSYRTIHMNPVTADTEENKAWSKYTPGGQLTMHVSNPAAFERSSRAKSTSSIFNRCSNPYKAPLLVDSHKFKFSCATD